MEANPLVIAATILVVLMLCWAWNRNAPAPPPSPAPPPGPASPPPQSFGPPARPPLEGWTPELSADYPYNHTLGSDLGTNRLYSTDEVDPLITGQLYDGMRAGGPGRRLIYGGRVSHGDKWGMREFSTGLPGQAGVDVGQLGLREYSLASHPEVFDDGIPENWAFPSTPMNWYAPAGRDYYDVEAGGPAVYQPGLMSLQEPDHDPLTN